MKQKGKSTNWTWKKMTETIHRRKERSKDRQKWKWTTKFITMKKSQSSEEEKWFMKIRNCDDYYLAIHSILHWSHRFHHEEETLCKKEKERKIEKEGTLEGLKRN